MKWPFQRRTKAADIARVSFDGRDYRIDRGVFDPAVHLSGMLFATHLASQSWDGRRVVELGTGCGLLSGVLADRGASVVALDIAESAVICATANLSDTSVDVRQGDLLAPVADARFDVIVTNPPYETGRSLRPRYSSPDFLARLATQWTSTADELVLAFPTDSIDVLDDVGFDLELVARLPSSGRELGVFTATS